VKGFAEFGETHQIQYQKQWKYKLLLAQQYFFHKKGELLAMVGTLLAVNAPSIAVFASMIAIHGANTTNNGPSLAAVGAYTTDRAVNTIIDGSLAALYGLSTMVYGPYTASNATMMVTDVPFDARKITVIGWCSKRKLTMG
jgi:hypothetical protein